MKPLLVICPGAMKSGTTSLYYHLYTSYILHFGHGKEHYYLNNIYNLDFSYEHHFKNNFLTEKFSTFKEHHEFKSFKPYYQKRTLEHYKNYFLEISEYYVSQKNMFYGVADFSQSYTTLSLDDVKNFRDYITEYFNVKIILMIRDPVKRLYSYCNMVAGKDKAKEYFYNILKTNNNFEVNLYDVLIKNWGHKVWGEKNYKIICYENLFNDASDLELAKLYEFLGIDCGLEIQKDNFLMKGNYQDCLSKEDINFAKKKLRKEYAIIHAKLNGLPENWEYANEWNLDCVKLINLKNNYELNPIEYY